MQFGLVGWIGNFFIIVGIVLLAYKFRVGFLFGVVGNALWGLKGYQISEYDLVTLEVIIVILQSFSYFNWLKYDRKMERYS